MRTSKVTTTPTGAVDQHRRAMRRRRHVFPPAWVGHLTLHPPARHACSQSSLSGACRAEHHGHQRARTSRGLSSWHRGDKAARPAAREHHEKLGERRSGVRAREHDGRGRGVGGGATDSPLRASKRPGTRNGWLPVIGGAGHARLVTLSPWTSARASQRLPAHGLRLAGDDYLVLLDGAVRSGLARLEHGRDAGGRRTAECRSACRGNRIESGHIDVQGWRTGQTGTLNAPLPPDHCRSSRSLSFLEPNTSAVGSIPCGRRTSAAQVAQVPTHPPHSG
jgi:hypothetical protein